MPLPTSIEGDGEESADFWERVNDIIGFRDLSRLLKSMPIEDFLLIVEKDDNASLVDPYSVE